jgi:hypothetical protein
VNKVALICWITVFIILMVGQVSGQNYQITWHNSNLEACQILDQNNYYVAGWTSTTLFRFMKSNDAGQTWQSVEVPSVQSSFRVRDLWMIDHQFGWICGSECGLYQTIDGGQTWIDASNRISSSSGDLLKIKFISPQIGYLLSSGDLKKTTNGGQTWTIVKVCQTNAGESGFRDFDIVGETILLSAGRYNANDLSNCHVSQDGGQTWQLSYVYSSRFSYSMKIISPNIFYASISASDMLYRSIDGGASWSLFLNFPNNASTAKLAWANNQLYTVVGHRGYSCIWKINNTTLQEVVILLNNIYTHDFDVKGNSGLLVGMGGAIVTFTDTTVANNDPVIPAVNPELTCYPNPFKSGVGTTFKFQTDHSPTTLAVYNIRGQLIRTLKDNELLPIGEHEITWDGKTDSGQAAVPGIYLCKLRSGKHSATRKVILVR